MQTSGGAVIERMSQRDLRLNPFQAEVFERQGFEKGRSGTHWMNRGANIMNKSRQSESGRARAAANGGVAFHYQHRTSGLGQSNGGGQALWTRADKAPIH